jgi:hypothetical protein
MKSDSTCRMCSKKAEKTSSSTPLRSEEGSRYEVVDVYSCKGCGHVQKVIYMQDK